MELDEPHLLSAALVVGCAQLERPVVCLRAGALHKLIRFLGELLPSKEARVGENFRANLFVKFGEFRQKLIADFNNPHGQLCSIRHYAVKGIF